MQKVRALISKACPGIDTDLLEYAMSYFDEESNEVTNDALLDFLLPIMSDYCDEERIKSTISAVLEITGHSEQSMEPTALEAPIQIVDDVSHLVQMQSLKVGDISHTANRNAVGKSIVDKQKLRKAEAKLAEKREKRGDNALYQSGIPVWDPDVKPAIIVNQQKSSVSADSRSKDLKLENFDISYAGKIILQSANMHLSYGRRYGLVGKNGVGKSTLLRAIAHGELQVPSHIRILHVEQEITGDDTPALQSVLEADTELQSLLKEEKEINEKLKNIKSADESNTLSSRLKTVYQALEDIEADKAESRALFCRPDLLLADEVTNYLDFPAVVWLENYFQNWKATLLVVSHDKSFLDAVSTDVLHLHNGQLDCYKGNFSSFVAIRTERVKNQIREYEAQLQYRQHLQSFIDRWRYNAKRAAQAQSKIKILEKLPPLIPPAADEMAGLGEGSDNVYFSFPNPEKLSPPILQMDGVTFFYNPERVILSNIHFDLQMDSRIGLVGPNGAGKSTLIKLLTGVLDPRKGIVNRHGRLRIASFSQHFVDQLTLGVSSVQSLTDLYPGYTEEEYRRVLARYGLTGMTALQPIGTLSGGQKSRVVFAQMAMSNPHVLVLDEPTNHLDMDSIDALSRALKAFTGGIIIVSHDERFLDSVCDEVWVCQDTKIARFDGQVGDMDGIVKQYKKSLNLELN